MVQKILVIKFIINVEKKSLVGGWMGVKAVIMIAYGNQQHYLEMNEFDV